MHGEISGALQLCSLVKRRANLRVHPLTAADALRKMSDGLSLSTSSLLINKSQVLQMSPTKWPLYLFFVRHGPHGRSCNSAERCRRLLRFFLFVPLTLSLCTSTQTDGFTRKELTMLKQLQGVADKGGSQCATSSLKTTSSINLNP